MDRRIAAALIVAGFAVSACSHAGAREPSWVAEEANKAPESFPDLRSVPTAHLANTDQRHWNAVAADVQAAAAALKANPRATLGELPEDPNAFLSQAQQDLDATRDSH